MLLDEAALRERVPALAARIEADHPDGVVLVGVLKGALVFLADLARAIRDRRRGARLPRHLPVRAGQRPGADPPGPRLDVAGRDVVLVEDLIDTGLTLAYLLGYVRERGPRRVEVCALLDRAERRIVPLDVRYVGIEVPGDAFLLGYGLHFAERYRNLPVVLTVDQAAVLENPDAYLDAYGHPDPGPARAGPGPPAGRRGTRPGGEGARRPRC